MQFPEEGLVYDYCLDDGGITKDDVDDDADEQPQDTKVYMYASIAHLESDINPLTTSVSLYSEAKSSVPGASNKLG